MFSNLYYITLFIKKTIDYRTQAIAAGNPVARGTADRVLMELARSGIGSVKVVRRHRPIIYILVEIS